VYDNFFGFKERPFQLVPNPDYLFLSRSHEEAIAHLNYAISHGDGFVEITGEVGTGKTTLCRAFLEDLDKDTEIAYIFNPRLNSIELLRTINDEFGIPSEADNAKDLIDTLNQFLIEIKKKGKEAILLIDEAQNLDKDVLEQIRLLSNLETNTTKLLQIILVGQPELSKILDSYELRQLRQRITLSWYLTPMTPKETKEYIRHRINIASKKTEEKFTESAYHMIYNYSGGIPRLINIACDRALLTAFGFNQRKVTATVARQAINELNARSAKQKPSLLSHPLFPRLAATFLILTAIIIAIFMFNSPAPSNAGKLENPPPQIVTPQKETPLPPTSENNPVTDDLKVNQKVSEEDFQKFLGTLNTHASRLNALNAAISLWLEEPRLNPGLNSIVNDQEFFQLAANQNNFQLLQINKDLDLIKKLNLPAILEFQTDTGYASIFLTLVKISSREIKLRGDAKNTNISISLQQLISNWSGRAYIPWKNFYNCKGDIPSFTSKESIFTLKMLLRDIGFKQLTLDNLYDNATIDAVKQIQEKHRIKVDGIVGSKTKIVIYNEKKDLNIPHIRE
jgi:general secretion pathway protein A